MVGASLLLASTAMAGGLPEQGNRKPTKAELAGRDAAMSTRFLENKGQWDSRAKFLAQAPNLNYWLTDSGYVLDFRQTPTDPKAKEARGHVVEVNFVGAKSSDVKGADLLKTKTDFFRAKKSVQGVRSYGQVFQKGLYSGVQVRNYFSNGLPRYDIEVAPRADASQVRLAFKGATSLRAKGDTLLIGTSVGDIKQSHLYAYQMVGGKAKQVSASFVKNSDGAISFKLGNYDRSKKLIIDPLVYGSYFGGNFGFDRVSAVVSEPDGGVFMTGWTQTTSFPVISGPYGFNLQGTRDAFITRFQGDAYNIDYNAYIGGTGFDQGDFIALDPERQSVWIAGTTTSNDLPGIDGTSYRQAAGPHFFMQFKKDQASILLPSYSSYFGQTSGALELRGFTIAPNGELLFAGVVAGTIETTGTDGSLINPRGGVDVFLSRFDATGKTLVSGRYFGGNEDDDVTGLAVDSGSNAVIAGTIALSAGGQVDTSVDTAVFETTDGVYPNGRLIRSADAYVARFAPTGETLYSAVIGGSNDDFGSGVAVDSEDNAYVLGGSGSFDFPRTRGVLGEQNLLGTVIVTKIRPSTGVAPADQIVYSTGLNTSGIVSPVGIAVDAQGNASITGTVGAGMTWTRTGTPPNPNRPLSFVNNGSVMTTADNIKAAYTLEAVPFYATEDCWLNTINSTATRLIYGTYIGSTLEDNVSPPYVDAVGDVWVFGQTFMQTRVVVPPWPTTGTPPQPADLRVWNQLPASHITALAFKPTPDAPIGIADPSQFDQPLGFREYEQIPFNPFSGVFPTGRSDGYILRFRNLIPTVSSVVIAPNVAAGGLGVTVTGTVTLGSAAPANGADINLTLDNESAAVFANGTAATSITIPAGQTTGTFTITTQAVTSQQAVNVVASYEGAFKVGILNVVPWLQSISVTPNTLVGGNSTTGRVNLAQAAPTGGVVVDVSTNNTTLITFPSATVTVPAGQTTATFTVNTNGVATQSSAFVTASILGVNRSQQVTLNTANLKSLSFSPSSLAGGGTTRGTLLLDGRSGSTFQVTLSGLPGTYGITPASPITVPANANSVTFDVATPVELTRVTRTVTATRAATGGYAAGTTSASFTVDVATVSRLNFSKTTLNSGETITATVELAAPAPAGGAAVNITYDPTKIRVPTTVDANQDGTGQITVAAGAVTSPAFNLTAILQSATTTTTVSAFRTDSDRQTGTLTINPGTMALTLSTSSVLGGGNTVTGTLTLATAAGPSGLTVNLTSTATGVTFNPSPVVFAAGETTKTFTITTDTVDVNTPTTIRATAGSITATASLTIRANGIALLRLSPSKVKGGPAKTVTITVTLDAVAKKDVTVSFQAVSPTFITALPSSRVVPAGRQSIDVTIIPKRVSRDQSVRITASTAGSSATALLTITR